MAERHLGAMDQGRQDIVRQRDQPHGANRKQSGSHLACPCLSKWNDSATSILALEEIDLLICCKFFIPHIICRSLGLERVDYD